MIKKNINPAKIEVGVRRVKKLNKGVLLMELNSDPEFEKLKYELITNENLKENYTTRKAEKINPKIIIYNLSEFIPDDELKLCIISQNNHLIGNEVKTGRNVIISMDLILILFTKL